MESRPTRCSARAATPLLVLAGVLAPGVWVGRVPRTAPKEGVAAPVPVAEPVSVPVAASVTGAVTETDDVEPEPPTYGCRVPEVEVERRSGCDEGLPYPACKWRLPPPHRAGRAYTIWRNTVDEHLWGRPALVATVLGATREYARHYPGEVLAVGDLDAPGPRHETHDAGVDVDLYLPRVMEVENLGGGDYAENYRGMGALERRMVRARVETLARILATCTQGRIRIYYNDRHVRRRFHEWFEAQGFVTPFGRAMQKHNDLHRFHFHVTIPKDLPLPAPAGGTT